MKKKRALILFGSITVLLLGYIAWCARPMYLSVPVPELLELPEELRADAKAIIVQHGLTGPDSFRWNDFIKLLATPYAKRPDTIVVVRYPNSMLVHRLRHGCRDYQVPVYLYRFPPAPWMLQSVHINGVLQPARALKASTP